MNSLETQLQSIYPEIDSYLREHSNIIIAIDGNSASGKTTLSNLLAKHYDCNIIHMDDFFLPLSLRTEERLALPGGNVHYERFLEEVTTPLARGGTITYRRFNCKKMDFDEEISLLPKPVTIVEGVYSMREEFRFVYDYTIFLSCPYEVQIERLRERNESMLQNFISKWIPMENNYFQTLDIASHCQKQIQTER